MKIWLVRLALIAAFPFVLAFAVLATLVKGIIDAFHYAWLEAWGETEAFRRCWKDSARIINKERRT